MKKVLLFIALVLATWAVNSQTSKKVLFIGNSYTAANNLPLMVSEMANSTGDNLIYDSHTPGGFRFMDQASNSTTLNKINSANWDFTENPKADFTEEKIGNEVSFTNTSSNFQSIY